MVSISYFQKMNKAFIILFIFIAQIVYGQNNNKGTQGQDVYKKSAVMKSVKASMKVENYSKALNELNNAIAKYDKAKQDAEYYYLQVKNLEQLALQENKNMYLATRPDTTKYFTYLYNMYQQALICDSIEQIPDLNGKTEFKYRYDNAETLLKYRQNLKVSTNFFYKKKDYKNAYRYVDLYCSTKNNAIFTNKKGELTFPEEKDNKSMAVMAVLSAYGSENNKGVVKYLDEAMQDAALKYKLLELGCKSYFALGDTAKAVEKLKTGYAQHAEQEYFFMSLVKYYNDTDNHTACLDLAKDMVKKFPKKRNYWFIKAKEEEMLDKCDDAIDSHMKAIALQADDAESYSSIGALYTSKAQKLYRNNTLSVTNPGYKEVKAQLKKLYQNAKAAYESAKKYAPNDRSLWYDGLRNAYFKLNMGKELKELEN